MVCWWGVIRRSEPAALVGAQLQAQPISAAAAAAVVEQQQQI
jgi:hypothetical protein